MIRSVWRMVVGGCAAAAVLACGFGAAPARAHPLGNFSVNHLDTLRFERDRIVDSVVIDIAEIPTAQAAASGGSAKPAAEHCESYRRALRLLVDAAPVELTTTRATQELREGQAGLSTTRIECGFEASVNLGERALAGGAEVEFSNAFETGRVGWHEIVATGVGVRLADSPVPTSSATGQLTAYPDDLLGSPVDVREARFLLVPGSTSVAAETSAEQGPASEASRSALSRAVGPVTRLVDRVDRTFTDLIGRRDLTVEVGLLAIGLAMVLGASHALLPGHGKTVMAAYIAGREGSVRDAVVVGATVTVTHTGGVLLLGLALTLSSALAGEAVLGALGVMSGLIIAVLGANLLRGALSGRPARSHHGHWNHGHTHHGHTHHGHTHHGHTHHGHTHHGHTHHGRAHHVPRPQPLGGTGQLPGARTAAALAELNTAPDHHHDHHDHDHHDHDHHDHDHHDEPGPPVRRGRRGLIGMGIAGGLVPSPSALVVLLSAIALGRTWFGIALVVGYGLGMAGTLTLAGVLLVRLRDRYRSRAPRSRSLLGSAARRWTALAPSLTATLVLVVGVGLAARSAGSFA